MPECTCGYHGKIGSPLSVDDPRWDAILACPANNMPEKTTTELRYRVAHRDALFTAWRSLTHTYNYLAAETPYGIDNTVEAVDIVNGAIRAIRGEAAVKDYYHGLAS